MAPIIHLIDPDGAREYLLRACALNDEMGNANANSTSTMFLALHELRSGDTVAAARWARRSLQLCVDVAPSYIAQTTDAIVAIVKRHSPSDAAVLLGALRAHRARKHQAGSPGEIDAEARYEASLRRALGDEFDALYAQGLALDETDMITLAFDPTRRDHNLVGLAAGDRHVGAEARDRRGGESDGVASMPSAQRKNATLS